MAEQKDTQWHTTTRKLGGSDLDVTIVGMGGAPLGDLYNCLSDGDASDTLTKAHAVCVALSTLVSRSRVRPLSLSLSLSLSHTHTHPTPPTPIPPLPLPCRVPLSVSTSISLAHSLSLSSLFSHTQLGINFFDTSPWYVLCRDKSSVPRVWCVCCPVQCVARGRGTAAAEVV